MAAEAESQAILERSLVEFRRLQHEWQSHVLELTQQHDSEAASRREAHVTEMNRLLGLVTELDARLQTAQTELVTIAEAEASAMDEVTQLRTLLHERNQELAVLQQEVVRLRTQLASRGSQVESDSAANSATAHILQQRACDHIAAFAAGCCPPVARKAPAPPPPARDAPAPPPAHPPPPPGADERSQFLNLSLKSA